MKQQAELCKARSLFITRGILNRKIIPNDIIYSWVRSKLHNISFEILDKTPKEKNYDITTLDKKVSVLLKQLRKFQSNDALLYLIDHEGYVIYHSLNSGLNIPDITNFKEEQIGTTAAGISLISGEDANVYGCEHYNGLLTNFTTESIVINDTSLINPIIIQVLTPIRLNSSHNRLVLAIKDHFIKTEEKLDEIKAYEKTHIDEEISVNTVKSEVESVETSKALFIEETSVKNVCKLFTLKIVEENTIREALIYYQWNLKKTAEALGIGRSTLYRKIKEYHIK